MKSSEIRDKFLKFFESKGHTIVRSSSLVPGNDPTLLFTNSGMVQFKDVFLGNDKRPYSRATTAQRCVRAGGKHNDLENVGYTARHHTFFEMLGNFSFRRLFQARRDPLCLGIADQGLRPAQGQAVGHGLPGRRRSLRHLGPGDRRADRAHRAHRRQQGRALRVRQLLADGRHRPLRPVLRDFLRPRPGHLGRPSGRPEEDGDRYIEIWNLVFMQFNRDDAGVMHPLPKPCVDTGMGLERIAAVLQHVHSNYEIDLFQTPDQGRRARNRYHRPGQQFAEGDRRPHPRLLVPDRRRRDPRQRRARLRAAPHHPPRAAPWPQAGPDQTVLLQAGDGPGARDGRRLSGTGGSAGARRAGAAAGRGALRRDAGTRHEDPRRRAGQGWRQARRRDRIHAVRHLRLPARPDRRHLPRTRGGAGRSRLRRGDGAAETAGARRRQVQERMPASTTAAKRPASSATTRWRRTAR